MKQFFYKYKTVLFRSIGGLLLVCGFAVHFWANQNKGYSQVEEAAANVARMEASVMGKSTTQNPWHAKQKSGAIFAEEYQNTRKQQIRYLTILAMVLGLGLLGYSFIKRDKKEQEPKD